MRSTGDHRPTSENKSAVSILNFISSALGLSHALGHKLGATYGIPHGITSVRFARPRKQVYDFEFFVQCVTLAPTVRLKARISSEEDKQWLAGALYQLHQPSTGSLEGDVLKVGELIDG